MECTGRRGPIAGVGGTRHRPDGPTRRFRPRNRWHCHPRGPVCCHHLLGPAPTCSDRRRPERRRSPSSPARNPEGTAWHHKANCSPSLVRSSTCPVDEELGESFLAYSLSVITSRAIPDVKDGLKPVQRRILYSMLQMRLMPDRPHRKCAHVVGDVMAKFHPHGDGAIYDALVRLGQDFARNVTLVDPQGNFGSLDHPSGRLPLHRVPPQRGRPRHAVGDRGGHGRVPPHLRRRVDRAGLPAGQAAQPPGQRHVGHRGGHGHQHADPQPGRGGRGHQAGDDQAAAQA